MKSKKKQSSKKISKNKGYVRWINVAEVYKKAEELGLIKGSKEWNEYCAKNIKSEYYDSETGGSLR